MDFKKDSYVKIVGVSGDYHYGFIEKTSERGFMLHISLYEEGTSALEYEKATGVLADNWDEMLSETEKDIIERLAVGYDTKDIAEEFKLSPTTIRGYIRTLRLKLQLDNRQQLVAFAQGMKQKLELKKK